MAEQALISSTIASLVAFMRRFQREECDDLGVKIVDMRCVRAGVARRTQYKCECTRHDALVLTS
jgi:hypothetical protein